MKKLATYTPQEAEIIKMTGVSQRFIFGKYLTTRNRSPLVTTHIAIPKTTRNAKVSEGKNTRVRGNTTNIAKIMTPASGLIDRASRTWRISLRQLTRS